MKSPILSIPHGNSPTSYKNSPIQSFTDVVGSANVLELINDLSAGVFTQGIDIRIYNIRAIIHQNQDRIRQDRDIEDYQYNTNTQGHWQFHRRPRVALSLMVECDNMSYQIGLAHPSRQNLTPIAIMIHLFLSRKVWPCDVKINQLFDI